MIFVHGYIHGDPHAGNILVSPEGHNGFSLGMYDTCLFEISFLLVGILDYNWNLKDQKNWTLNPPPPSFCNHFAVLLDHAVYRELDEEFRKDFCQLWEALILKDSKRTMWLGERFGAGKYSRYLPIIFTGTTIERSLLNFLFGDAYRNASSFHFEDYSSLLWFSCVGGLQLLL